MDLSSRRAKKTNVAGVYFSKWRRKYLEAKIQNGCHGNSLFIGLTYNDAQYMVSDHGIHISGLHDDLTFF